MGCDIHTYTERKAPAGEWESLPFSPFNWRNYGMYAFLAGVRNYSAISAVVEPRGLPDSMSPETAEAAERWDGDRHTCSWLTVRELMEFDYDAEMEDRRVTRQVAAGYFSGGVTCAPGEGEKMTFRTFLGPHFFQDIEELQRVGADRVVFWFDN